ncbi:MAG: tyrosine-type recombinase/integrase, partial [Kiritimatiellae bacterium]|nr:tyrosine-type recombinase/integrase [Kiritimatiellia bacterium]
VADAWAAYEQAKNRPDSSERTLQGYETSWRKFAAWLNKTHPDKTFMRDIAADAASGYAQQLTTDGLTASTFNQYIGLLRLVWRCLAEQIRGTVNPWMQIAKRRTQKLAHRRRTITPEQFDNLLKAADDADYHDLFFVLGMTGQRLVDGLMLRWDSIDFKRRVITLNPRKTARTEKAVFIPLLPALAELLQKRRDMVAGNLVFPDLAAAYDHDSSAISKRVQEAFAKAGLKPNENRPGVKRAVTVYGAHSLRHFFATQALSAGIPGEIVKRITGHSSDAMLEGYEHVDAAMISGLAAKLGNGKQPLALPAPQADIRVQVRALADRLNGKNWQSVKKEFLKLAN